jgi:hypothetical protein
MRREGPAGAGSGELRWRKGPMKAEIKRKVVE